MAVSPWLAILPHRGVLSVSGPDAFRFVNGLCTRNLLAWAGAQEPAALYAAFLSAQGRMLYDAFIFKSAGNLHGNEQKQGESENVSLLIDCDRRVLDDFSMHLKQYRLRARVQIQDVSGCYRIAACMNMNTSNAHASLNHGVHSVTDARFAPKRLLERRLYDCELAEQEDLKVSFDKEALLLYEMMRMQHAVPEGAGEISRGKAIPIEYNMHRLGAIDTDKGCYLGQELVARTLHRGVIRKELYSMALVSARSTDHIADFASPSLYAPDAHTQLAVANDAAIHGKSETVVGRMIARRGNCGIAQIRIEEATSSSSFRIASEDGSVVFGKIFRHMDYDLAKEKGKED